MKFIILIALAATLIIPAAASADTPDRAMRDSAREIADTYWSERTDSEYCSSGVSFSFHRMRNRVLGYVWQVDNDAQRCVIHINTDVRWTWAKFCSTAVHEWGHIVGRHHSSDINSIMYPSWPSPGYGKQFWACY